MKAGIKYRSPDFHYSWWVKTSAGILSSPAKLVDIGQQLSIPRHIATTTLRQDIVLLSTKVHQTKLELAVYWEDCLKKPLKVSMPVTRVWAMKGSRVDEGQGPQLLGTIFYQSTLHAGYCGSSYIQHKHCKRQAQSATCWSNMWTARHENHDEQVLH